MQEYKNFTSGYGRALNTFVFSSIGGAVLGAVFSERKIRGSILGLVAGVFGSFAFLDIERKRKQRNMTPTKLG